MPLVFEWDEGKTLRNVHKRGVSFAEARTIFNDPWSIMIVDAQHSHQEQRWLELGLAASGRLLVVWYTECENTIRIIGARVATPREARTYSDEHT